MSPVLDLVERAAELGYPALGLTDHGRVAGVVDLYRGCKKAGIKPLPGIELYLTPDHGLQERSSMHLTVVAYSAKGYRNLIGLSNLAQSQFYRRPRVDFADLADFAERGLLQGLACATGCRSGPVVKALTERGEAPARQVVETLAGWFPRTYVELMDHGFKADGMWDHEITDALLSISSQTGVPIIITTDSHYVRPDEVDAHDALKTLVSWSDDPDDRGFSGSGYWLKSEAEIDAEYDSYGLNIDAALDHLRDLAEMSSVQIPELDTFTLRIPDVTLKGTQLDDLAGRAKIALTAWLDGKPAAWVSRYHQRLEDELEVISQSGFAGYLLLVAAITDYCREHGIWFHTRGSASGSLILYLLGVTQLDPVARDIRFDRFLSPDRTSPPDVDLDIEHTRRDEVVDHFRQRYPILQVGTTMTFSISGRDDDDSDEIEDTGKPPGGSLLVKYFAVKRKEAERDRRAYMHMKWADIPPEDKAVLRNLSERNLVSGRGAHPGGYIIAADAPSVAFMPLETIGSSKTLVTSLDKDDVEAFGLPKIDLLGSKVLTALHICCDLIAGGDGRDWYDAIDEKDKPTLTRCGSGNTQGLFQLSGWTNRSVAEDIRPTKIDDIIAVQALGRPATLKSGFTKMFMARRTKAEPVPPMHNDITAETKDTYGLAIYQEQLVGVLRRLGLEPLRLTKLLKAVKASGKAHAEKAKAVMDAELNDLLAIASMRGWSEADRAWLTQCLQDYGAGYSFGKAHAWQYGLVAYRTAWLATHEPLAFWTGMLIAYTGAKNSRKESLELLYKRAARGDGVKVLGPHVHTSGVAYTADPDTFSIREGLTSVPGVGTPCAEEILAHRPFASLVDMAQRVRHGQVTGCKKLLTGTPPGECGGQVQALYEARALDGIAPGEPIRKAKGRIRKCKTCKITYSTPLEYEDHLEGDTCPSLITTGS